MSRNSKTPPGGYVDIEVPLRRAYDPPILPRSKALAAQKGRQDAQTTANELARSVVSSRVQQMKRDLMDSLKSDRGFNREVATIVVESNKTGRGHPRNMPRVYFNELS